MADTDNLSEIAAFLDWLARSTDKEPLQVSAFMQAALSHPEWGYYARKPVFGKGGDFITAPEITQLFGEMLAGLLIYIWQLYGKPDATLFEAGPGRGTLLADMDRTYRQLAPDFAKNPWRLYEASPALRAIQTEKLADNKPQHITDLDALPPAPLFGVANEFFDALGVNQFLYVGQHWHHRLIAQEDEALQFCIGPKIEAEADPELAQRLPHTANEGDIFEYSPSGIAIMEKLAHHIAHYGGALLICDYGKTDGHGDSLQAIQDHQAVSFLSAPGVSDLTHWVDFQALADSATQAGARLIGPQPQGKFLKQLGIESRANRLRRPDAPGADRALVAALDRLLSPAQMGQVFKVALLVPAGEGLPPGFATEEGQA